MANELEIGKSYVIDWEKVNDIEDVIRILKLLGLVFTINDEQDLMYSSLINDMLLEVTEND